MNTIKKNVEIDEYSSSRKMYIIAALIEYLISITITGAYLAKITTTIGISDSLTGILTSFVSLGTCFQIFAVFISNKTNPKKYIIPLHIINQLCFAFLYIIPLVKLSAPVKSVLFIILLLAGHGISNVITPKKINWQQSFIPPNYRGVFTAKKEIISLFGGMLFSLIMGNVIDYFESIGNLNAAFIICAITVFALMISHSLSLLLTKNNDRDRLNSTLQADKVSFKDMLFDKQIMKITVIFVLWSIAHYAATPFYGTYQIVELQFNMGYVSILTVIYSISRAAFSIPFGRIADKYSFRILLTLCFAIDAIAYFINTFTVPENGKLFYTTYYILAAIAMAGINSGSLNIIYEYVPSEKRTGALAFKASIGGTVGFLTTLIISRLVNYIQANGNKLFGINIYAQQLLSAFSCVVTLFIILYLNTVIVKLKKAENN